MLCLNFKYRNKEIDAKNKINHISKLKFVKSKLNLFFINCVILSIESTPNNIVINRAKKDIKKLLFSFS